MIYNIEEKNKLSIESIVISVGNGYIKFKNIQCGFKFEYPIKINQNHIKKIEKHTIDRKNVDNNDIIIDIFNNYYTVDNGINIEDPINLPASSITGNYSVIYANNVIINKINNYILNNKLNIISFVSTVQAASIAVIDNKISNSACISIGNNDTGIAIVENGNIKSIDHINTGGSKVTNDLIKIFGISYKDAENIKILVSNIGIDDDYVLSRDQFPSLSNQQNIQISDVYQVIYKNINEIFLEIISFLNKKNKFDKIQNIILTGGVAKMLNIDEIAQTTFKKYCTIGTAQSQNWILHTNQEWQIKIIKSPDYTTVLGLGGYLLKKYKQSNLREQDNYITNQFYKITSFVEELFY